MVVPPGGERVWIDLTSSALREETAGHLTGPRFLPSAGNHTWYIVILVLSYHILCLEWLCPFPPQKQLYPALSACTCSAVCRLAQGASAVFHCLVECALVRYLDCKIAWILVGRYQLEEDSIASTTANDSFTLTSLWEDWE